MAQNHTNGDVCAVLDAADADLQAAVRRQLKPPDAVFVEGGLRAAVDKAARDGATWMWLVDKAAVPRPDALAELMGAAVPGIASDDPTVLAGIVRTPEGSVDRNRTFWFRSDQVEAAMDSVTRRLLPIRAASGPILVSLTAARARPPRPAASMKASDLFEWTATLLKGRQGFLVPSSEHDQRGEVTAPVASPATVARLLVGGPFGKVDRLRVAYEAAERVVGRLAPRAAADPEVGVSRTRERGGR